MNIAVVLAGGTGSRMNANMPKQFIELEGKPILARTLEAFAENTNTDGIIVVTVDIEKTAEIIDKNKINKVLNIIKGGATRRESSYIGCLEAERFSKSPDDVVLIHDAARPFITSEIIDANIAAAQKYGACETAVPVVDTVIRGENGFFKEQIERESLYRVQTPQSFRLKVILDAHRKAAALPENEKAKITDDAGMCAVFGTKARIVEGDEKNIKITRPQDLVFAEKFEN